MQCKHIKLKLMQIPTWPRELEFYLTTQCQCLAYNPGFFCPWRVWHLSLSKSCSTCWSRSNINHCVCMQHACWQEHPNCTWWRYSPTHTKYNQRNLQIWTNLFTSLCLLRATSMLWAELFFRKLTTLLRWGHLHVFSVFFHHCKALDDHDKGRHLGVFFFWKHRIATGWIGQFPAFYKTLVFSQRQGRFQQAQCTVPLL